MSVCRLTRGVSPITLFVPLTRCVAPGRLPADMQAVVESMWRRRVLARGTVWRNDHGQVVKIDIEHLEPLPEEPATPAPVGELLGIAPDWLVGMSPSVYRCRETEVAAGMPPCVAKQVRPVRNREAPVTEP